jgi:5-formyltetrahydrofolate cyclo-ligase
MQVLRRRLGMVRNFYQVRLMGSVEEKRRIRREMRERRRSLGPGAQRMHAWQLKGAIQYRSWFRDSRRLGCYWATDGEISLEPLIALGRRLGKRIFLPVVGDCGAMQFREYCSGDPLRRNRMGILEPLERARAISAADLDVVFVPLVAFTPGGHRLGMGGGYYDRLFSRRLKRAGLTRGTRIYKRGTTLVGVAHDCQMLNTLPVDDWDVPMHMIVTESGTIRPAQSD